MTIPRRLGPETGRRTVLPDFHRSSASIERMVSALSPRPASSRPAVRPLSGRRMVRVLLPASPLVDTLVRSVVSAAALGGALAMGVALILLWATVEEGRSPGVGLLLVMSSLALAALVTAVLGLRFGIVALGTARSRVEISEDGLRVVGVFSARDVPWTEIRAIDSRVVHPVHWLTAALRLHDGTQIVMPSFDRHIWTYTRPSGQDVRALRTELRRRRRAARRPF